MKPCSISSAAGLALSLSEVCMHLNLSFGLGPRGQVSRARLHHTPALCLQVSGVTGLTRRAVRYIISLAAVMAIATTTWQVRRNHDSKLVEAQASVHCALPLHVGCC